MAHRRLAALACLALLSGCLTFRPLSETLRARPLSLERLGPARIDVEASSLTLQARPKLGLQTDILRLQIADALNAELDDPGRAAPAPARFRARVVANESTNIWAVALAPFTLVCAGMLPYVHLTVQVELELQVGGATYNSAGEGSEEVTALGPKIVGEALQAAVGLALNDALGKLQPAAAQ